jgi:hypothetical protein
MKEFNELPIEHIQCACYSELLQLVYDNTDEEKFLYITLYKDWFGKTPWMKRLSHIWYIIRYGQPWIDSITLNTHEIKKLRDYLNKILK